jgi:uncharacterized SAM-binding protein YcdF (DUF218 family)
VALRKRRPALVLLGLGILLLWTASTPWVAKRLVASLEDEYAGATVASLPSADAILLLGGAMQPAVPPREFPEVSEAGDRVIYAARLLQAGKAPLVVASGGARQTGLPAEAHSMRALLIDLGVPPDAIVLEEASTTTRENCVHSKALLDAHGAKDVLLVTSAVHMRRALATCGTAGLGVRAAATDFWVAEAEPKSARDLMPSALALVYSHLALHEWLGFWVYERRGWIER